MSTLPEGTADDAAKTNSTQKKKNWNFFYVVFGRVCWIITFLFLFFGLSELYNGIYHDNLEFKVAIATSKVLFFGFCAFIFFSAAFYFDHVIANFPQVLEFITADPISSLAVIGVIICLVVLIVDEKRKDTYLVVIKFLLGFFVGRISKRTVQSSTSG